MLQAIAEDTARRRMKLQAEWMDAPAMYRVTVVREYKSMGGSHGLTGLHVGDVLEVLQEDVGIGNDRNYFLCRKMEGQIGWFPKGFVERIPEKKRAWWAFF